MNRHCPVCDSSTSRRLYHQTFSQMSEAFPITGYDVVVCSTCGCGYADDLPAQTELDAYYKGMSKYENEHRQGKVSTIALANYQRIVDTLGPFLPGKHARIADIGCATGGLLSAFHRNGYANLLGIDPSPACAQTAAALYGLHVITSSLFDVLPFDQPFDVLVFSSVLEHVIDLNGALARMSRLLDSGGLMFIEVPDTVNFAVWSNAPFQQFSIEHVNFFTPASLANLLRRHGFEPVAIWHDTRSLGGVKDPSLTTVFRKADHVSLPLVRDYEAEIALRLYIQCSQHDDAAVLKRIAALVESQQPILVWGVGTQTQRLLATTALAHARIRAFVDSNPHYHGHQLNGVTILAPSDLARHTDLIVIASSVFQEEIEVQIRDVLRLLNPVVRLFDASLP